MNKIKDRMDVLVVDAQGCLSDCKVYINTKSRLTSKKNPKPPIDVCMLPCNSGHKWTMKGNPFK